MGAPPPLQEEDFVRMRDGITAQNDMAFVLERDPEARRRLLECRILALVLSLRHRALLPIPPLSLSVSSPPSKQVKKRAVAPITADVLMRYLEQDLSARELRALEHRLRGNPRDLALLLDLRDAWSDNHNASELPTRLPTPTRRVDMGTLRMQAVDGQLLFRHEHGDTDEDTVLVAASRSIASDFMMRHDAGTGGEEPPSPDVRELEARIEEIAMVMRRITEQMESTRRSMDDRRNGRSLDELEKVLGRLREEFSQLVNAFSELDRRISAAGEVANQTRQQQRDELTLRRLGRDGWADSVVLEAGAFTITITGQKTSGTRLRLTLVAARGVKLADFEVTLMVPGHSFKSSEPRSPGAFEVFYRDEGAQLLFQAGSTYVLNIEG